MKIAIYVNSKFAKANYKKESYNMRLFAGVEIVKDVLERGGFTVYYCSEQNVNKFDIILVSITAQCDWYQYIQERERWPAGGYKVVVGGAGLLNVRPFLKWFDVCVWGRAENIILKVVKNIDSCHGFNDCVAESIKFSTNEKYIINQTCEPYKHKIKIGQNTRKEQYWKETGVGCKRKCKFCAYTWHRRNIKAQGSYSNDGLDVEFTMLDLDMSSINWCTKSIRNIGLDGVSERLRKKVNKPISKQMLIDFIYKKAKYGNGEQVKFFNVVGYPTECDQDYDELLEVLTYAEEKLNGGGKISVLLGNSPFRAMPATPAAIWAMPQRDFRRNSVCKYLKKPSMPGNVFFQGTSIWAVEWMGTDSLSSVILDAIALRGTENDIVNVAKLARTKKFWTLSSKKKEATLRLYFDVDSLMKEYDINSYPVKYLAGIIENKKIMRNKKWQDVKEYQPN